MASVTHKASYDTIILGDNMLGFRKIKWTDQKRFNRMLLANPRMKGYLSSELVFYNLFCWRKTENVQIKWFDSFGLVMCYYGSFRVFLPPIASSDASFLAGIGYIKTHFPDIPVNGLTEKMVEVILDCDALILEDDRLGEYIYLADDLIELKGVRYHRKRNQLNQFKKKYDFLFRSYQDEDQFALEQLLKTYQKQGGSTVDFSAIWEAVSCRYADYVWVDVLYVDNKMVALSVSHLSPYGHGVILFEKADIDYIGVYTAINQMVIHAHFEKAHLITRQEDLGIPALRKAKMAYHPLKKDKKYQLNFNPVVKEMHTLYQSSFDDPRPYVDQFFLNQTNLDHMYYLKQDGQIVAGQHVLKKRMRMKSLEMDIPFLVATATHPSYRLLGYMRKLMIHTISHLTEKGNSCIMLYPEDPLVYERVGFIPLVSLNPIQESWTKVPCELEVSIDTHRLNSLYQAYVSNKGAYTLRDASWYEARIQMLYVAETEYYLILSNGNPLGYALISGDTIEEWVTTFEIFPLVPGYDFSAYRFPTQEKGATGVMVRITDPLLFLRQFSAWISIDQPVCLTVKDSLLDRITSLWIRNLDGQLSIDPTNDYGVEISIQALADMIFHGASHQGIQLTKPFIYWAILDRY